MSENPSNENALPPDSSSAAPDADAGEQSQGAASPAPPPARRMRVAWVAAEQTVEKLARILKPLAVGLLDELIEVVALCPEQADVRELPSPPLEILRYGPLRWLLWRTRSIEQAASALRSRKVNLLHALEAPAVDLTRLLAAELAVPYLASSYGLNDAATLRAAEPSPQMILPASMLVRDALIHHRAAEADRLRLVRPGVYQVDQATCFTDPQYSVTIVANGRLDDPAPWQAVVGAFCELHQRKYDCAFFIVGSGRGEKQVRATAERLGLRGELTFSDALPISQLADIFKAADVYISPVPSQEVDINALLAMAAGTPVLAVSEGASDFVINGKTCLIFQSQDAQSLAAKLIELLDDRPRAAELANGALEYLRQRHSAAGMVALMAQTYRDSAAAAPGAQTAGKA